jgi:hypothetical protein
MLGLLWWGFVWAWGGVMSAAFILAPLLLANMAVLIRESIPATVALAGGVVVAYVMDLPPWDADEPESLPLVVGGTAIAVVIWDIMRNSADVVTLLVALAVATIGWPLRRFVSSGRQRSS